LPETWRKSPIYSREKAAKILKKFVNRNLRVAIVQRKLLE